MEATLLAAVEQWIVGSGVLSAGRHQREFIPAMGRSTLKDSEGECTISRNGPARFRINGPTLHGLPALGHDFGGVRNWLTCKWCCRRCAILYGVSSDGYFACRRCLKLGYSNEAESPMDRLWRKQRKLEAKLGEDCQKPKWMRLRTYERFWTKIDEVEEMKDHVFCIGAMALFRRHGSAFGPGQL